MTAAIAAFDRGASAYDEARRRLIPTFDAFYGAGVGQLGFAAGDAPHILDLGAGTGLLSAAIRRALPKAHLTLVDAAPAMIELARQRFAGAERISFLASDYSLGLPTGPFDAVVSALSIHHLDHSAKHRLFGAAFDALVPGGIFVNLDQVLAPTPEQADRNRQKWRLDCTRAGATAQELADAEERMRHDILAPLIDQLNWLNEVGFVAVDIAFKDGWWAVYSGRKP
ncbi:MAG: methyltransferase domain-containing protein [Magnetospirillum sp.]|nr:methyltransferase domain-containing protein [Magnetospirillum sp.]